MRRRTSRPFLLWLAALFCLACTGCSGDDADSQEAEAAPTDRFVAQTVPDDETFPHGHAFITGEQFSYQLNLNLRVEAGEPGHRRASEGEFAMEAWVTLSIEEAQADGSYTMVASVDSLSASGNMSVRRKNHTLQMEVNPEAVVLRVDQKNRVESNPVETSQLHALIGQPLLIMRVGPDGKRVDLALPMLERAGGWARAYRLQPRDYRAFQELPSQPPLRVGESWEYTFPTFSGMSGSTRNTLQAVGTFADRQVLKMDSDSSFHFKIPYSRTGISGTLSGTSYIDRLNGLPLSARVEGTFQFDDETTLYLIGHLRRPTNAPDNGP